MRYLMEIAIFLIVLAVPALVLATLIIVLAPVVFGDGMPQRDQASGQDGLTVPSARAEAHYSVLRQREIWTRSGYDGNTTVTPLD